MYVIVVYDISDVKVQSKIRNFLRKFLIKSQLSVFEGEINPSQLREIEFFLKKLSIPENESVIIYILRDQNRVKKIYFGEERGELNNII